MVQVVKHYLEQPQPPHFPAAGHYYEVCSTVVRSRAIFGPVANERDLDQYAEDIRFCRTSLRLMEQRHEEADRLKKLEAAAQQEGDGDYDDQV